MTVDRVKARIMSVMRNLPPLPAVTRQLMTVLGSENATAGEVARVLSSDQALAGKVLKLVNSSFYGMPTEVTTISRAVVVLGFTGVRNLALGFGSIEMLKSLESTIDMKSFWSHSLATGAAAQNMALLGQRRIDPEEAFLVGLMHDIGAYVLAAAVPDIYGPILKDSTRDRLEAEAEAIGMTHAQVGQGLLQFWELPEAFSNAARYHHDIARATDGQQPLTGLVALADVLATVWGHSGEPTPSEADLRALINAHCPNQDRLRASLDGMRQKIAETAEFMQIALPDLGLNTGQTPDKGAVCVVITTEDDRRDWSELVLRQLGHRVFPMQSFFNQDPGAQEVSLVLMDGQCLSRQQLDQLLPFIADLGTSTALMLDHGAHVPRGTEHLTRVPIVFTRSDLEPLLTLQKA
ncbi:MAG: HDOD domain-containing protein [bacterium]|nr:HDOD domain-containing protein [bacterium]MBK9777006.1 HDOD domain-containing protein [bacterium]